MIAPWIALSQYGWFAVPKKTSAGRIVFKNTSRDQTVRLVGGKVRVSMRSKSDNVDVSAICEKFGGGGHKLAAGARVPGSLADVETKILEAIYDAISSDS